MKREPVRLCAGGSWCTIDTTAHSDVACMQVLRQCERWCPDVEPVMTSMQPAPAARQAAQLAQRQQQPASAQAGEPSSPSAPQWGWDDLKYAAGDTLNTGGGAVTSIAGPDRYPALPCATAQRSRRFARPRKVLVLGLEAVPVLDMLCICALPLCVWR